MAATNLIIVESPTKARTIGQFVGDDYDVQSSYGHVRDLPKSKLGIDLEKNFEPQYVIPTKVRKRVNELKKKSAAAKRVILATDEDREGEAIAWHLAQALGLAQSERIVFHEITKKAIAEALANPRGIKQELVNAQQARRILDRLVGYLLSPFLWKKISRGLSAGRVQSAALRLIVEREEEIRKFKPEEYWTIAALLRPAGSEEEFEATLSRIEDETIPKLGIKTEAEAKKIVKALEKSVFQVTKIEKKETKKHPLPPFTTSTLQQAAFQRLRFSAKQTMRLAQNLYERGFITYMRTDSVNLSEESLTAAKNWIEGELGRDYLLPAPRKFKTKSRLAQEAHEAIRPTQPELIPENLESENAQEKKLYDLIWRRFLASQLPPATFDATAVEITAGDYGFKASGLVMKFNGFLKIWKAKFEEKSLPRLAEGEELELKELKPSQHFTEPPPRYNEASLVKTLETYGIGRPSTYAPIISVIQERNYVEKDEQRRFRPTEMGELVNKVLTEHFPEVVDIQFTARMEEDLDEIAGGEKNWPLVVKEFYDPFAKHLEQKYEEVSKKDLIKEEKTEEKCEKCGRPMVIKTGRYGRFLACSGFPECKNTKSLKNNVGITDGNGVRMKCPKCGEGEVIRRRTRKGRFFYGCSRYPDCDFASWTKPAEVKTE